MGLFNVYIYIIIACKCFLTNTTYVCLAMNHSRRFRWHTWLCERPNWCNWSILLKHPGIHVSRDEGWLSHFVTTILLEGPTVVPRGTIVPCLATASSPPLFLPSWIWVMIRGGQVITDHREISTSPLGNYWMIKHNNLMRYLYPVTIIQLLDDNSQLLDELSTTHHQQTASIQLLRAIWHDDTADVPLITTTVAGWRSQVLKKALNIGKSSF